MRGAAVIRMLLIAALLLLALSLTVWMNLQATLLQPFKALWVPGFFSLIAVVIISLLLILASHLSARRSTSTHLQHVTDVIARIGNGELQARVNLPDSSALSILAQTLNHSARRLERSQEALNQQVEKATWELRQTLEAVELQNVELDFARNRALVGNQAKSEFLANMSHEIRTPINGILGFLDLLSHSRLDEEQLDYIHTIKDSCTDLLSLVNNLLDFSKMEAGKPVIDCVTFNFRDCVEDVLSLLAPAAFAKHLELVQLINSDVPLKLHGDPIRIRQILTNLIHNAIKFTPKGMIVLRVMLEEHSGQNVQLRVTVTDTGIGMSACDQENLFQAFGQADTSITRRFGGAGLGLIICKKLLEQMGGEIGLESQPDQGSMFWFTLDCECPVDDNAALSLVRNNPLSGRRVLLYDANQLSRQALRHALESWQMIVVDAESEKAFLSRLTEPCKWDMAMLGLARNALQSDLLASLNISTKRSATPLVVLASTIEPDEMHALYQQGPALCLPKSVRRHSLYRELCRTLSPQNHVTHAPSKPATPLTNSVAEQPVVNVRALVVDDNKINRKLVCLILAGHGVIVDEAADGKQALGRVSQACFDLVLMDIHMPVMSGETAFLHIRDQQAQCRCKSRIVALTANALPGERERLLRLGMHECLIKPITEQQILAQVRIAIETTDPHAYPASGSHTLNQALEKDLHAMLLTELPIHKRAIQMAYGSGDRNELREQVHGLRGAAAVCHFKALKAACEELDRAILAQRCVDIQAGKERVLSEIEALL